MGKKKPHFYASFIKNSPDFITFGMILAKSFCFQETFRKGRMKMRKKNYKGRCTKIALSKCKGICKTYDEIEVAYAYKLETDDNIAEIRCNVVLDGLEGGAYVSDFVCIKTDGDLMVRECVFKHLLTRPSMMKLLDESRNFWRSHGIFDWGIVTNAE